MNINKPRLKDSIDRDTVRSVSKLLLTAAWIVLVMYLFTLLPGIDRIVPQTPVTFVAVAGAIATLAIVGLLLYVAPKLALLVRMSLDGSRRVTENIASVVYWLVVLAAVLVAHRGLAGIAAPAFDGSLWIYDTLFLLLALPAVVVIGARLYANLEPGSDFVAEKIAGRESESTSERGEATGDRND
jgi:hypothetical protein